MPASPRSPTTATGKAGEPLARLLKAAEAAGYAVDLKQAVSKSRGVNPTRVDLRLGPHHTKLLVYSWYVTHEGFGRTKDDFRIQTTRSHDGPLKDEQGRVTVGIGLRLEDDVFVAFDAWAKRYTGKSSSVHINAATVASVKKNGVARDGARHDPRLGFDAAHVIDFVKWAHDLHDRKDAVLAPHDWTLIDENNAEIVGKVHSSQPTSWMREKDRLIVINTNKKIINDGLWQIRSITPFEEKTPAGRPRRFIKFQCRRLGTVKDLPKDTIEAML